MYKSIQYFNEICAKKFDEMENEFIKEPTDIASYVLKLTEELHMLGVQMIKETLEDMNEMLNKSSRRKINWVVDRHDNKTLITSLGAVNFKKTLFKNKETSERSYLLDVMLGIEANERMTDDAEAKLLEETVQTSYRRGGDAVSVMDSVSKQTVMNKLHKLKFPVYEALPDKKVVKKLYIDADEDHISLQYQNEKGDLKVGRNGRKNNGIITKLIYVYEGIEEETEGNKRHKLINPHYFSRTSSGIDNKGFWDEVFSYIEKTYDVGQIEKVYINGDGGNWIEEGKHRLPTIITTLDEFHLQKYLLKMINHMQEDKEDTIRKLRRVISRGKKSDFIEITTELISSLKSDDEGGRKRIEESSEYIMKNWSAAKRRLRNRYALPGCSAEGHVSHVLSSRMSTRPMGWSKKGADAMAQLRAYYYNKGDMLELVRYQKKALPKASGAEREYITMDELLLSEKNRRGQLGKYYDTMQTSLTLDTKKHAIFNSNMKYI